MSVESKLFAVLNTQKGLFCYTRLLYGLPFLGPGNFPENRGKYLKKGILGRVMYLDDILGKSFTHKKHLKSSSLTTQ